jgi:hypothetical protein
VTIFHAVRVADIAPWIILCIVLLYFTVVAIVFHRRPSRSVGVTRYRPPEGISPAVAACLVENGRAERAFAAVIVSLAAKGALSISEAEGRFELENQLNKKIFLSSEEAVTLTGLFPGDGATCTFNTIDPGRICQAYSDFCQALKTEVEPQFLSPHTWFWLFGAAYSLCAVWVAAASIPALARSQWSLGDLYLMAWILLGGFCFVAALRVWPATIRKLISWLPGIDHLPRPFTWDDAAPIYLTASAAVGFGLLAYLSSRQFAAVLGAVLLVDIVSLQLLQAPTREGRKMIATLVNFRDFLSRVDADRLNRENEPGKTPRVLEQYAAYAIALDVENAWGEEFADHLLALIHWNEAYSFGTAGVPPPAPGSFKAGGRIDLNLRDR